MRTLILILIIAGIAACSKSPEPLQESLKSGVGTASPRVRAPTQGPPITAAKQIQPSVPRMVESVAPVAPITIPAPSPSTSRLIQPENPADNFEALSGRHISWSYNPEKFISRDRVDCPPNRIDSFCMGRDYRVIQKVFGNPNHATHDTWTYRFMKVKYLAGGGIHRTVKIQFLNGKVCALTTEPGL